MTTNNLKVLCVSSDIDYELAKKLFIEYANEIEIDLEFQNFSDELESIKDQYGEPQGGIIILKIKNSPVGVVGIRSFEDEICELKRMFIKPAFRGKSIGGKLLSQAIKLAKALNYTKIRLDTLDTMKSAIHIYTVAGFREIKPYRYNPHKGSRFFELDISTI